MNITEIIDATIQYLTENDIKESTILNKELSQRFQLLLDTIKCAQMTPDVIKQTLHVLLMVFNCRHWIRKLTAGTTIVGLLQNYQSVCEPFCSMLVEAIVPGLKNEKREVRDICAQIIAALPEAHFEAVLSSLAISEKDDFTYREALSMLAGYRLRTHQSEKLVDLIEQNLKFQSSQTNVNYVHWYSQRALGKAISAGMRGERFLALAKLSFNIPEMRVRKSAGETAGLYFASSASGRTALVSELLKLQQHKYKPDLECEVHSLLIGASVAVQIITGTHISLKLHGEAIQPAEAAAIVGAMHNVYEMLPMSFEEMRTLDGLYKHAAVVGVQPTPEEIAQLMDTDHVMCLDAGINAAVYMQRFFRQTPAAYRLQLLLLAHYSSKAISVLALRALNFDALWAGKEIDVNTVDFNGVALDELAAYVQQKALSHNVEIRQAAMRLAISYLKQTRQSSSLLVQAAIDVLEGKRADAQSMRASVELLALVESIRPIDEEARERIAGILEPLLQDRDDCAGAAAKYFAVTRNERMCQFTLIYAFDAVNLQLSEACKPSAPLAMKSFNADLMVEAIQLIKDAEPLVLNGLTRLLHAIRFQCGKEIAPALIDAAKELKDCEDFFPECQAVFEGYLRVLEGEKAPLDGYMFKVDSTVEFDEQPFQTATFLSLQWPHGQHLAFLQGIIQSKNAELTPEILKLCSELLQETTVQPEVKQLLVSSLLGVGALLPDETKLDVKKNEVFDFNKING